MSFRFTRESIYWWKINCTVHVSNVMRVLYTAQERRNGKLNCLFFLILSVWSIKEIIVKCNSSQRTRLDAERIKLLKSIVYTWLVFCLSRLFQILLIINLDAISFANQFSGLYGMSKETLRIYVGWSPIEKGDKSLIYFYFS